MNIRNESRPGKISCEINSRNLFKAGVTMCCARVEGSSIYKRANY